jgi:type IV pilus biogenesis protein PilP
MPNRFRLSIAIPAGLLALLVGLPGPASAEEPSDPPAGTLAARTAQRARLSQLDLDIAEAKKKKDLRAALDSGSEAPRPAVLAPPSASRDMRHPDIAHLTEIGGAAGRLRATFRLSTGDLREAFPGDTVPGFGRIREIHPDAVIDERGHAHPVAEWDR